MLLPPFADLPVQAFGADNRMSPSSWEPLSAPAGGILQIPERSFSPDVLVVLCVMANVVAWLD